MPRNVFEVELWDKAKHPLADITELVHSQAVTLKRNGVHTFQFSMDLDKFEKFCRDINAPPRTLLWPFQTDVIIKLDGSYWKGFEVAGVQPFLNQTGSTLSVRATGFLNLFSKRYTNYATTGLTESTDIAAALITTTQGQTNGDFGVTIDASNQFVTGVPRERSYQNKNIRDELINLAGGLESGHFDFDFTYDKKFQTFAKIGAVRTDLPLRYGPGGNIKSADVPTEGQSIANKVTGLGSGFGKDQLNSPQSDATSQLDYGVREELPQWPSILDQTELDQNTLGYLAKVKDMLQIPNITVTGEYLNPATTSVGDRFKVDLTAHPYTDNINGLYRVDEMSISWDDNGFPTTVLKFDDNGVDQNESF